jgi:hypothetical protein
MLDTAPVSMRTALPRTNADSCVPLVRTLFHRNCEKRTPRANCRTVVASDTRLKPSNSAPTAAFSLILEASSNNRVGFM